MRNGGAGIVPRTSRSTWVQHTQAQTLDWMVNGWAGSSGNRRSVSQAWEPRREERESPAWISPLLVGFIILGSQDALFLEQLEDSWRLKAGQWHYLGAKATANGDLYFMAVEVRLSSPPPSLPNLFHRHPGLRKASFVPFLFFLWQRREDRGGEQANSYIMKTWKQSYSTCTVDYVE